jgi:hypothetical protein
MNTKTLLKTLSYGLFYTKGSHESSQENEMILRLRLKEDIVINLVSFDNHIDKVISVFIFKFKSFSKLHVIN